MKSPFPGMDPYLDQRWRDVHTALAVYAADALHRQLPEDLVARIDYDDDGDSFVNCRVVVSETIRPERSVTVIEIISPLNKSVMEHCDGTL